MIKAVLFDLDNTLIDFMAFKRNCCSAALKAMIFAGLKIDKKRATKILFKLYDKYGIEYNKIFQKFLQKTEGNIDYKILANGIIAYRKMKENYLVPYTGVKATLKKLKKKKYKLAIISDAPKIKAWERLVAMGIDSYFDAVVTKGNVKVQKPSSKIFRKALQLLKVKPKEAVMVGDRIERDIKGAKALGIRTVFARYGNKKVKKSGADYEIKKFDEILGIVK